MVMNNEDFSKALEDCQNAFKEYEDEWKKKVNDFWDLLPYDDRLKAFHYVTSKIYEGDIKEKGSYRSVLYNTFGFHEDAYVVGMLSNYMEVHNSIYTKEDLDRHVEKVLQEKNVCKGCKLIKKDKE
jgi:hypothetical protein